MLLDIISIRLVVLQNQLTVPIVNKTALTTTSPFAGENVVLKASYRRVGKDVGMYTSLLPFFGTDYGLCTLIKPQITFDYELDHVPFEWLMRNYTNTIKPGIQLGKENGLSILLDAEVSMFLFNNQ